jgi:DNA-binding MarR family transcriptional regulator
MGSVQESTQIRAATRLLNSDLAADIEFLAARARAIGSANANTALAGFGLRVRSYSVLSLACNGLEPTQRELADFLSLDPSQIVPLIDELEKQKLVRRRPDPRDRRSKVLVATPKGEELNAAAAAAVNNATAATLSDLTAEESETLRQLLWKVAFTNEQRAAAQEELAATSLTA